LTNRLTQAVTAYPVDTRWWLERTDSLRGLPFLRDDGVAGLTDGFRVALFIETFCRYTKDEQAGELVILKPWQVQLLCEIFEVDRYGTRMYRRGLLGVPRKNGKSMLGAGIALYGLVGDDIVGAEVYSCAGDKLQAKLVFNEAKAMVEMDAHLSRILRPMRDEILYPARRAKYVALSAEAYTKEGLNPTMVIFDELHVQPNGELYGVMRMGSATRKNFLLLSITTAGYDKDSLCGKLYSRGREHATWSNGAWRSRVGGMLFIWYEPREADCDHTSSAVWQECNPGLSGDQPFLIEVAILDELNGSEAMSENEFRRYRLNQWTGSIEAWLPYGVWDGLSQPQRLVSDGERCVTAFDGSWNNDSTAYVGCTTPPNPHIFVLGAWERPAGPEGEGWRVDIDAVEEDVRASAKRLRIEEIAFDPYRWQRTGQALEDEGLPMVEFPNSVPRMVKATKSFYDAVMDGTLTHDGDPRLARHITNAHVKRDAKGPRITKETPNSSRKIDLAVAAVMAYDRAIAQPEDREPQVW
jgi:phage terminase large subunit-like protein